MYKNLIRLKVLYGYPLTPKERSEYLLYIASKKEAINYLKKEKEHTKIKKKI